MSCKVNGTCNSDDEPLSRRMDFGRLVPPRRPVSRHVVNPNFMFFCQIVLLVIPVTILYAGLYFMNLSSRLIVIVCGAIILVIFGIFLFVRPFKEEKREENKPLRQSYGYTPIEKSEEPTMKTERPQHVKHRPPPQDSDETEEEGEHPPLIKEADTPLSVATSNTLSEIATQSTPEVPGTATEPSTNGRCRNCQTRGYIIPAHRDLFENTEQPRPSMGYKFDGGTWDTKRFSTVGDSMGVIEEEGAGTSEADSPRPSSPYSGSVRQPARILRPDLALTDTTHTSCTMNNELDTAGSSKAQYLNFSESSGRRTMPGYTTPGSSGLARHERTKPPPTSQRGTICPRKTEPSIHQQQNQDSHLNTSIQQRTTKQTSYLTSPNKLCLLNDRKQNEAIIQNLPKSASQTATGIPQRIGTSLPRNLDHRHLKNKIHDDYTETSSEMACNKKLCPLNMQHQTENRAPSNIKYTPHSKNHSNPTNVENEAKPNVRRGYVEETQQNESTSLITHGKQNIFEDDDSHKCRNNLLLEEQDLRRVQFQMYPTEEKRPEGNRKTQPILIKLFPTSSKVRLVAGEVKGMCAVVCRAIEMMM